MVRLNLSSAIILFLVLLSFTVYLSKTGTFVFDIIDILVVVMKMYQFRREIKHSLLAIVIIITWEVCF